jgi:hypothetical protein
MDQNTLFLILSFAFVVFWLAIMELIRGSFENFNSGWLLAKNVKTMLFKDKELLAYPAAAVLGWYAWLLFVWYASLGPELASSSGSATPQILLSLLTTYWIGSFITLYFSAAMMVAWKARSSGEKLGMIGALRRTFSRALNLLVWALIFSIIMIAFELLKSLFKGIANWALNIAGQMSIIAATFFVTPIIVEENAYPLDAIHESFDKLVDTFGVSFGGFSFANIYANMLMIAGVFLVILVQLIAPPYYSPTYGLFALAMTVLGVTLFFLGEVLGGAMMNLFRLIVYDYAAGKPLPDGVDGTLIREALIGSGMDLDTGEEGKGESEEEANAAEEEVLPVMPGAEEGWDYVEDDIRNLEKEDEEEGP